MKKNIFHNLFSIATLCAVVFTNVIWLTGCVIYDSKDLAGFAKEQLYEKYGEEFEVKTIMDSHRTIAYPVNNPDLLFEVYSLIETRSGKDDYIQSIIGDQYKQIDEMSGYSTQPEIELYLCSDFLEHYNDEELYSYFQTVVSATDLRSLTVYFIQTEDRRVVEDYFSEYPSLSCNSNLIGYLDGKYDRVAQGAEQGVWNMNMDDFNKKMEEIRKNELYG